MGPSTMPRPRACLPMRSCGPTSGGVGQMFQDALGLPACSKLCDIEGIGPALPACSAAGGDDAGH